MSASADPRASMGSRLEDHSRRYSHGGAPITRSTLVDDFSTWLRSRDTRHFFYHRGYLAADRVKDHALDVVAEAALIAAERGDLFLVQRRLGDGNYNYLAIKPKRRR